MGNDCVLSEQLLLEKLNRKTTLQPFYIHLLNNRPPPPPPPLPSPHKQRNKKSQEEEGRKQAMASSHAVLRKKLEEVEAQVIDILQSPIQLPYHDIAIYRIRSKVDFIKNLLAAENGSSAQESPDTLQEMADRLSVVERKFVDWASSGEADALVAAAEAETGLNSQGKAENLEEDIAERLSFIENNFTDLDSSGTDEGIIEEGVVPPTLCKYCLNNEEEDKGEDEEDKQELQEEEEKACSTLGVTEEKTRKELEVILEKIVAKVTEKVTTEKRRRGWHRRHGMVGVVAAVAAAVTVGLVIGGFGSVDESVYLVPT